MIKISQRESAGDYEYSYHYYDGFANLVQLKTLIENNQSVTKNIFYDGLGRVSSEQNPYFETFNSSISTPSNITNKTYYTYDALDRVVKVTNPDNTNKTINFNKYSITDYDENNHRHEYLLDSFGRITNVIEYNVNPNANNLEEVYNTSYVYDVTDNLVKITDNEGNEFKFAYDSLGRKTKLVDPDLGTWTYEYDAAGNLIQQNDSIGNVILLSYDKLNRIVNKTSNSTNITFVYDAQYQGTLTNLTMGNIKYRYTYDDRLRLVKFEKYLNGAWKTQDISYDSMDRVIQKVLPRGELEYYYNKQGKVKKLSNYLNASFNAFGSILSRNYSNGKTATFTYNSANNRLTNIAIPNVQNMQYTYDSVGNIMSITDSIANRNYKMGYDGLDRLINTTINSDIYKYEYDSIGNIKRIVEGNNAKRLVYQGSIPHAPSQIVDLNSGAGVYTAKVLNTNSKNRTVEFFLTNEKASTTNAVNWSINFGQNKVNSTIPVNLSGNIMVLVQNNYSSGGVYNINISTAQDWNIFKEQFGVRAKSLDLLENNRTVAFIEFIVENDVKDKLNNVRWNCSVGIGSTLPFNPIIPSGL